VLIAEIVAVVVVAGLVAAVMVRRRSHDDEHSVEHYHRQLHTLEELRGHPPAAERQNGNDEEVYPASTFRVSGSSTVRLTESDRPVVPPVPPPPVANPAEPVTFDDSAPDPVPATFMSGSEDRVLHSINHRPRRVGGPIAAVAAVAVLVAVLIATGLHTNSPPHQHHGKAADAATTTPTGPRPATHRHTTTTTSTAPPAVSAPSAASAHAATYEVTAANFSLAISATTSECWVEATDSTTGSVLFTATLFSGQSHAIAATGPVTVIAGAPSAFTATVNGAAVTLPPGYQAPFTLKFLTAPASTT
jgi:hypothetical protein